MSEKKPVEKTPPKVPRRQSTVLKKRFVEEMCNPETRTATEAAIKAGYSEKNASHIAWENLQKEDIQQAIEVEKQIALVSARLDRNAVLGRLAQFAFASMDMFVDERGNIDWQLAKETGAFKVIKSLREIIRPNGEVIREIYLHDPIRAISEIADFAGWKQQPRENDQTIEKVGLAFSLWLEDNPNIDSQEKQLWLERFANGAGISIHQLAERVNG